MTVVPVPSVLFVKVSALTLETNVEFAPAGNNNSLVTPAECGCDLRV